MYNQFRIRYPKGSLISEFVTIDREKYIVRALVKNDDITLATGLAAADTIEKAEDKARERALVAAGINLTTATQTTKVTSVGSPQPITNVDKPIESNKPPSSFPKTAPRENSQELAFPELHSIDSANSTTSLKLVKEINGLSLEEKFPPAQAETLPNEEQPLTKVESNYSPEPETAPMETKPDLPPPQPVDYSDIIAKTNIELKRLRWTNEQGRDYLLQTYGKRSRQLLSGTELVEFLAFLESQSTPS